MNPSTLLSLLLLVECSAKAELDGIVLNGYVYHSTNVWTRTNFDELYRTNDLIVANFEYGFLEGGNDQYSFSIKSNRIPTYESVFTLKMRDGNWDNSAATNIVLTTIYEPIVTKSNDQWVITFKEKRK